MTDNPIGNVAPSNFTGLSRMSYLHFGDRPATSGELARYRAPGIMPGLYQLRMAGANQPPRIDEQLDTDGNATRELPENSLEGTAVGMPLSATDPEGGVLYYIAGENTGQFTINESNGQLLAGPTESYDFEDATKNSYTVNVEVTDEHDATAMIDVKVTITNVDEAGTVMLSATAPKQGIAVTATLTDPDGGVSSATWQWASSNDGGTTWTDLSGNGADTASYTPQSGDVGNLLRATASYDDAQGSGKSASAQTGVVGQPPPKVTLVLTPDTIDEGGSGNVSTVTATLPAASSAATTITVSVNPTNTTTLSSNTTLTIAAGQTASTGVVTITAVDDNAYTGDKTVAVSGSATNTVEVTDPDNVTLTITEDEVKPVTVSYKQASYTAAEDSTVSVAVTLSAAPERQVVIPITKTDQGGVSSADYSGVPANVTFGAADREQSFTFSATMDSVDDDGESVLLAFGTLPDGVSAGSTATSTVSITDDDVPAGQVTLVLTPDTIDEDGSGNVSTVTATLPAASSAATTITVSVNPTNTTTLSSNTTLTIAAGQTASTGVVTITAVDDNAYTEDKTVAVSGSATNTVEVTDPDNVTLTITDDDAPPNNVPDFGAVSTTRAVDEGASSGTNVGAPVTATDADMNPLTYTLGGTDASSFDIAGDTGQITVGASTTLDYETDASYSVTVTATDTSVATDTIDVTINVNNVDEPGTVTLSTTAPRRGTPVTASLDDPDGGISSPGWQWANSDDGGTTWTDLSGAGAATDTYTPQAADVGKMLQATASYADNQGPGKSARAQTGAVASSRSLYVGRPQGRPGPHSFHYQRKRKRQCQQCDRYPQYHVHRADDHRRLGEPDHHHYPEFQHDPDHRGGADRQHRGGDHHGGGRQRLHREQDGWGERNGVQHRGSHRPRRRHADHNRRRGASAAPAYPTHNQADRYRHSDSDAYPYSYANSCANPSANLDVGATDPGRNGRATTGRLVGSQPGDRSL